MPESTRWPELDGLRALAVLGVLAVHLEHTRFLAGGYLGVDVFFVLSGFILITWLLVVEIERTGRLSLTRFYARRGLRLIPALAVAVVLAIVIVYTVGGAASFRHGTLTSLPWTALYAENWRRALLQPSASVSGVGLLGHAWSLSIEEQFYVVWPVVAFGLLSYARLHRRTVAAMALAGAAATVVYRFVALVGLGWSAPRTYYGTDLHSDGLLVGCALALWLSTDRDPGHRRPVPPPTGNGGGQHRGPDRPRRSLPVLVRNHRAGILVLHPRRRRSDGDPGGRHRDRSVRRSRPGSAMPSVALVGPALLQRVSLSLPHLLRSVCRAGPGDGPGRRRGRGATHRRFVACGGPVLRRD